MARILQKIVFNIPGHLPSRANERVHWRQRRRLSKSQRDIAHWHVLINRDPSVPLQMPLAVTMVRVSPRLLDDDNLATAFKNVRDGIADAFGVDDSPSGPIEWTCAQRKGSPACAEIQIEEVA